MTDITKTHISMLLDRSGSMATSVEPTVKGFDEFIAEQAKVPGECLVTLAQFDTEYEIVYKDKPIIEVPGLVLQPRGMTALLDGIGRLINETGRYLSSLPEEQRPGSVIFVIMTDGGENSSHEFTIEKINDMITEQTNKYNWLFVFIGANQDAIATGASIGIPATNSMTYDTANAVGTYESLSSNMASYRSMVASGAPQSVAMASASFTPEQREAAVKKDDKKKGERKTWSPASR